VRGEHRVGALLEHLLVDERVVGEERRQRSAIDAVSSPRQPAAASETPAPNALIRDGQTSTGHETRLRSVYRVTEPRSII